MRTLIMIDKKDLPQKQWENILSSVVDSGARPFHTDGHSFWFPIDVKIDGKLYCCLIVGITNMLTGEE